MTKRLTITLSLSPIYGDNKNLFQDTYLVNVSASVVPTKPAEQADNVDETLNMISTTEKDVVVGKRIKNEE